MKTFCRLFLFLIILSVASCASNKTKSDSNLTKTKVEERLVKGRTTKASVVELLGSPEMINSDSEGAEQWVYSKHSWNTDSNGGNVGVGMAKWFSNSMVGLDLGLNSDSTEQSSRTTTLTVYFNKKGVVQKYNFSRTKF